MKEKSSWKEKAEKKYFIDHLTILQISDSLGISRQHIAKHLSSCSGFGQEKDRRKQENAKNRMDAKRIWDRENRQSRCTDSDTAMLVNDHRQAVAELSHEKYH